MRILLVNQDTERARELHSKLLSYQGISWDLRHSHCYEEAALAILKESYDVILLYIDTENSKALPVHDFELLRQSSNHSPIVVILNSTSASDEMQWMGLGADDVLRSDSLNTNYLMRRMRLSMARSERQQAEQRHAIKKLVYQRSAKVLTQSSSNATDEEQLIESIRMRKGPWDGSCLSIAVLRERGAGVSPNNVTSDLHLNASVEIFKSIAEYKESLELAPNRFDVCLIEQELYEREGVQEFDRDYIGFPAPPTLLIASDRSDITAISHVLHGFDDSIPAQTTSSETLVRYARFALARWECTRKLVRRKVDDSPNVSERRINPRTGEDRRQTTRYLVTRPIVAIPVGLEGEPDKANIREAFSLDFSIDGIAFQISNHGDIPARNWIIGVECSPNDSRGSRLFYSHAILRSVSYPQGGVRLGTQFKKGNENMLSASFLLPKFNPENGQFLHSLPDHVLEQWAALGVLQPRLLHRIRLCPECEGTATLGGGCSECGSASIRFREQMRHFECGEISDLSMCKRPTGLGCPCCGKNSLLIGTNVEIIRTEYTCSDCGHHGNQTVDIGTCLHCRSNFSGNLAEEREIYGYDVDRFDVLSVINANH